MRYSFVAAGLEEGEDQFFALALTVEKEDSPRTLKKDAMLPTSVRRDSRRIREYPETSWSKLCSN